MLKDTSLCAIVRDEEFNPAGGVERWLRTTLPHVEEAVVVDTGSIDSTKEILERLQKEFNNLRVYRHEFKGFPSARNYSLSKVKTKKALVLDADELLTSDDFRLLEKHLEQNDTLMTLFYFLTVYSDGSLRKTSRGLNPRLFYVKGVKCYCGGGFEDPVVYDESFGSGMIDECESEIAKENGRREPASSLAFIDNLSIGQFIRFFAPVSIKHFKVSPQIKELKDEQYYAHEKFLKLNPLDSAKVIGWKQFNPERDNYGP